jgi:bifunctional non-homologous end joining protein LigD
MKPISTRRPSFIEPMQALLVEELPDGDWLYEVKLDGYRALAFKESKGARLISRNNKPLNYPQELDSLKVLAIEEVIHDGEIVALDEKSRSSFQLLQDYKSSEQRVPLVYYAFDLLFLEGKDLRKEPPSARRKLLVNLLKKPPENIRLSDGLRGPKMSCSKSRSNLAWRGLSPKRRILSPTDRRRARLGGQIQLCAACNALNPRLGTPS